MNTAPNRSTHTLSAPIPTLPEGADRTILIQTIDAAIDKVLEGLNAHQSGELPADLLSQVQSALVFLDQCLAFKDLEFTGFARQKAAILEETVLKATQRGAPKSPQKVSPPEDQKTDRPAATVKAKTPTPKRAMPPQPQSQGTEAPPVSDFPYEREEKILFQVAFDTLKAKLAFVRGDTVEVIRGKAHHKSIIMKDGLATFFLLHPDFPKIIQPAFESLIEEKRDLLTRRVYVHTDSDDSDEVIRQYFQETALKDIISIIALGFDGWSRDIAQHGIVGLPNKKRVIGAKKTETPSKGIGASLKKVFGLKSKDKPKPVANAPTNDTTAMKVHRHWKDLENKHQLYLSQHFSFDLIGFVMQIHEGQFTTEFTRIEQIVNQQDTPDVGPVVTNLTQLYKFHDNIFFDFVILALFYRRNKFDINMLQAACMSQNFVVERLPLCMDELRRRPMEHAKHIVRCLSSYSDMKTLKAALSDYFNVHETIHASKVGKRIQASENYLKRHGEQLDPKGRKVITACEELLHEIGVLKARQESEGVYLGEEIQETIESHINKIITQYR